MEETSGIVTVMEEVEIFTIPALFTPYKVDRESIYHGLHLYEIQARQDDTEMPFRLMERTDTGFYGSILTPIPVDRMENGQRDILPGDFILDEEAEHLTPSEFEEKYLSPDYDPQ